jgi:hypothetical protein
MTTYYLCIEEIDKIMPHGNLDQATIKNLIAKYSIYVPWIRESEDSGEAGNHDLLPLLLFLGAAPGIQVQFVPPDGPGVSAIPCLNQLFSHTSSTPSLLQHVA